MDTYQWWSSPRYSAWSSPIRYLVNLLLKDWLGCLKFVDDTTAIEIVPRCSSSIMPLIVDEISNFSSSRGMELNQENVEK